MKLKEMLKICFAAWAGTIGLLMVLSLLALVGFGYDSAKQIWAMPWPPLVWLLLLPVFWKFLKRN
jgi:hypothetical protein